MEINSHILKELLSNAKIIASEAGKILTQFHGKAKIKQTKRDPLDIATEADQTSEDYIIKQINSLYPQHSICSEETGSNEKISEYKWIIDPLDGTREFVRGLPTFYVNIAIEYKNKLVVGVVYSPAQNILYSCSKDNGSFLNGMPINVSKQSRPDLSILYTRLPSRETTKEVIDSNLKLLEKFILSSYRVRALPNDITSLIHVATGAAEGLFMPHYPSKYWDIAPGILLVQEAGGKVTTGLNNEFDFSLIKNEGLCASNSLIHDFLVNSFKSELI